MIAGVYLAGTNTRRVRLALATAFSGSVGKDVVSRTWRKVKGDWDAWNAHLLVDEPVVGLILDGTVARVRLDKKATSVSLLVALGVRADGQKVLCSRSRPWAGKARRPGARCRRSRQARIAAGAGHRRWCAKPRKALAALWPTRQDHIFVVVRD